MYLAKRKVEGLAPCWSCGSSKRPQLVKNARGYFRFQCESCGAKTFWGTKDAAIVEWFNRYLYGDDWFMVGVRGQQKH